MPGHVNAEELLCEVIRNARRPWRVRTLCRDFNLVGLYGICRGIRPSAGPVLCPAQPSFVGTVGAIPNVVVGGGAASELKANGCDLLTALAGILAVVRPALPLAGVAGNRIADASAGCARKRCVDEVYSARLAGGAAGVSIPLVAEPATANCVRVVRD